MAKFTPEQNKAIAEEIENRIVKAFSDADGHFRRGIATLGLTGIVGQVSALEAAGNQVQDRFVS